MECVLLYSSGNKITITSYPYIEEALLLGDNCQSKGLPMPGQIQSIKIRTTSWEAYDWPPACGITNEQCNN